MRLDRYTENVLGGGHCLNSYHRYSCGLRKQVLLCKLKVYHSVTDTDTWSSQESFGHGKPPETIELA